MAAPGDPTVRFAAAKSASETALRLDSRLSDAYTARGMVRLFQQDFAAAQQDLTMAIKFDSTQYEPWQFRHVYYFAVNDLDSAVTSLRRAKALAPVEPIVGVRLATALRFQGHIDRAEGALADVLGRDPTNYLAKREQFEIDVATRRCSSAARNLRSVQDDPVQVTRSNVAYHWASCGEPERARSYADSIEAQGSTGAYLDSFSLAVVYAGLGDSDKMFRSLNQAVAAHNPLSSFFGTTSRSSRTTGRRSSRI